MAALNWLFISLLCGLYITGPIIDPDLWWHITTGRWILAHAAVPQVDYWNMFGVSQPWRAYSWSNEILFALLERAWGMHGLLSMKLLIGAALALSLSYCLARISGDYFFGLLVGCFATLGCFNHFTLRPQSLVWLYFIWFLYNVECYCRSPEPRRLILIGFLISLWANSHISTPLGIVTGLVWAYEIGQVARVGRVLLACLVGLVLTPYFGAELLTFSSKISHPFRFSSIAEFQPANLMQYSTAFLIMLAALTALFIHNKPKGVEPPKLFLALGFTGLALAVVKFLPFALFVLAFVLAKIWAADRRALGNLGAAITKLKEGSLRIPAEGLACVILALIVVSVRPVWLNPSAKNHLPIRAVDFIQQHNLSAPILNTFGDGGYLIYRFSDDRGEPKLLVPIDGRTNVTPAEIFKKQHLALRGSENWHQYFEAVKPETVLWRNESPLSAILIAHPEWCRVYKDGTAERGHSVFVKREALKQFKELKAEDC